MQACNLNNRDSTSIFYEFDNEGPGKNTEYLFNPFDSVSTYRAKENFDIILEVRYNGLCKIKTLPIAMEAAGFENDSVIAHELQIPLFDTEDIALGKGKMGVYEIYYPLFDNLRPSETFFISLSTPLEDTQGIISWGIIARNKNGLH